LTRCCQIKQEEFSIRELKEYSDSEARSFKDEGDESIKRRGEELYVKENSDQLDPIRIGEGAAFAGVNSHVSEMLDTSASNDRGQLGLDLRINKQRYTLTKISQVKVEYKCNEYKIDNPKGDVQQYELWIDIKTGSVSADKSPISEYTDTVSPKSWSTTRILLFIMGIWGVHMLYLGRPFGWIIRGLTFNFLFIGWFIDIKTFNKNALTDGDGKFVIKPN